MSRTYREFGDLLSAYEEADEKWMPIQKAHELLDSVNEDEIWEQRHAAADALFKYIAELEGEVTRLLTERDDAIMAEARYIAEVELAKKDTRIAELKLIIDKLVEGIDSLTSEFPLEIEYIEAVEIAKDWKEG